jgi:hypothetical protein
MYDFSHPIADAVEGITHSLCTLEFEDHRPLYDWVAERILEGKLVEARPRQIEFSRLNLKSVSMCRFALYQCNCSAHQFLYRYHHQWKKIYRLVQTKTHQTSKRTARHRLGRSSHAHPFGDTSSWNSPRGHSTILRTNGYIQVGFEYRFYHYGRLCARNTG